MSVRGRAGALGSAMVGMLGLVALGGLSRVVAYEAGPVSDGGRIVGTVRFAGTPPPRGVLEVTRDTAVCGNTAKLAPDLVVGPNGGLQDVVVALRDVRAGKPFAAEPPTLDQRGCEYRPHVLLVPAGRELTILNSDNIMHNIHTYSLRPEAPANPPLNRAQPKFKTAMTETFHAPEFLRVGCDVHRWMQAWIVVVDHPYYAVTDANGEFTLTDVPPGEYQLHFWHETVGGVTRPVSVGPAATATVRLEMPSPR